MTGHLGIWLLFSSSLPFILGMLAWRHVEVCTAMLGFACGLAVAALVVLLA
jgi:hypothetical protein